MLKIFVYAFFVTMKTVQLHWDLTSKQVILITTNVVFLCMLARAYSYGLGSYIYGK